ncbi:MAG: PilZ domain-containing protein [Deltaproteobacteria bacterium]|nr:PilZ domain-containing protein [Deltaproteobacteria bacterium]MBW2664901.1 PilZ domain-containing protein [Deltaproteobacteria bacterium]
MATANLAVGTAPMRAVKAGERREAREDTIRIVEYSRYPRDAAKQRLQLGFTRDLSRMGMCVGVDREERVGALLKLCVRDVDGGSPEPTIARVVWTRAERDGRFWLGLELLPDACHRKVAA